MVGHGDAGRTEAERLWSERQQSAAVAHDRERAHEAWRDEMTMRQRRGPVVQLVIVMAIVIGALALGHAALVIGLAAAIALIVALLLIFRPRR